MGWGTPSGELISVVNASRVTGFLDYDFGKTRELGVKSLPDPLRQVFTGWVFQPLNLVQIVVIQLVVQWLECRSEIGEIHNPTLRLTNLPTDMNFYFK